MEETITIMAEVSGNEVTEVGPNDIVIHLVNPYKCGHCEEEYLEQPVFLKHMLLHLEDMKMKSPSAQLVMTISMAAEAPGGVTITRDILQLGADGSIRQVKQLPKNIRLHDIKPLRDLEEAGVISLDRPSTDMDSKRGSISDQPTTLPKDVSRSKQGQQDTAQDRGVDISAPKEPDRSDDLELMTSLAEQDMGIPKAALVANDDGTYRFSLKSLKEEKEHIEIIPISQKEVEKLVTQDKPARKAPKPKIARKKKTYECELCGKHLSCSTSLSRHRQYHKAEKPYRCEVCNRGFKDNSNLKKHTLIHKREFNCHMCKRSFLHKALLMAHLRQHESRSTFIKNGSSSEEVVVRTVLQKDGMRMEVVSMKSLEGETFEPNGQKRMQPPEFEPLSPVDLQSRNIKAEDPSPFSSERAPVTEEIVRMYQCGHCGKETIQRGNMMRHLLHHLKKKPYSCEVCSKQFVDKGELVKHENTHFRPYRCSRCKGAFTTNTQLLKHVQTQCLGRDEHLNYTVLEDGCTHKCDVCGVEMKRLGAMIKHVSSHKELSMEKLVVPSSVSQAGLGQPDVPYFYNSTKELYFCGFCSKSYKSKRNVLAHVQSHTSDDQYKGTKSHKTSTNSATFQKQVLAPGKPFKCDLCPLTFSRTLFLKNHKMRHHGKTGKVNGSLDYGPLKDYSGYYCKHCNKELANEYRMLNHVKVHGKDCTHECPCCNKCFSSNHLLQKHKKVHTMTLTCKLCKEKFDGKLALKLHMKKKHREKQNFSLKSIGMSLSPNGDSLEKISQEEKKSVEPFLGGSGSNKYAKVASLRKSINKPLCKSNNVQVPGDVGRSTVTGESLGEGKSLSPKGARKVKSVSVPKSSKKWQYSSKKTQAVAENTYTEDGMGTGDATDLQDNKVSQWLSCAMCQRNFKSLSSLSKHLKLHREGKGEDSTARVKGDAIVRIVKLGHVRPSHVAITSCNLVTASTAIDTTATALFQRERERKTAPSPRSSGGDEDHRIETQEPELCPDSEALNKGAQKDLENLKRLKQHNTPERRKSVTVETPTKGFQEITSISSSISERPSSLGAMCAKHVKTPSSEKDEKEASVFFSQENLNILASSAVNASPVITTEKTSVAEALNTKSPVITPRKESSKTPVVLVKTKESLAASSQESPTHSSIIVSQEASSSPIRGEEREKEAWQDDFVNFVESGLISAGFKSKSKAASSSNAMNSSLRKKGLKKSDSSPVVIDLTSSGRSESKADECLKNSDSSPVVIDLTSADASDRTLESKAGEGSDPVVAKFLPEKIAVIHKESTTEINFKIPGKISESQSPSQDRPTSLINNSGHSGNGNKDATERTPVAVVSSFSSLYEYASKSFAPVSVLNNVEKSHGNGVTGIPTEVSSDVNIAVSVLTELSQVVRTPARREEISSAALICTEIGPGAPPQQQQFIANTSASAESSSTKEKTSGDFVSELSKLPSDCDDAHKSMETSSITPLSPQKSAPEQSSSSKQTQQCSNATLTKDNSTKGSPTTTHKGPKSIRTIKDKLNSTGTPPSLVATSGPTTKSAKRRHSTNIVSYSRADELEGVEKILTLPQEPVLEGLKKKKVKLSKSSIPAGQVKEEPQAETPPSTSRRSRFIKAPSKYTL